MTDHDATRRATHHPKLAHLSPDQVAELVAEFEAGVRLRDLVLKYRIRSTQKMLRDILPPRIHDKERCARCGEAYWAPPQRPLESARGPGYFCAACGHRPGVRCECKGCEDERRAEIERFLAENVSRLRARADGRRGLWSHEDLSLEKRIWIVAFVRAYADRMDGANVEVVRNVTPPLAPTAALERAMIRGLYEHGALEIIPERNPRLADDGPGGLLPENCVAWRALPSLEEQDAVALLKDLDRSLANTEADDDALVTLWKAIVLEECIEYLEFLLCEYHMGDGLGGETTREVLARLLEHHPAAEVFFIMSCQVRAAVANAARSVPRFRARTSIPAACQRMSERWRADHREMMRFHRDTRRPQSVLSALICDVVLRIGGAGFTQAPTLSSLRDLRLNPLST